MIALRAFVIAIVLVFIPSISFAQRTGGSFGVRAWGARPVSFSRPAAFSRPVSVSRPSFVRSWSPPRPVVVVRHSTPSVFVVHHHHTPSWVFDNAPSVDAGMPPHTDTDGCSATPLASRTPWTQLTVILAVIIARRVRRA